MSTDYGQFCGLGKAAGVLGEQWAMLVLRDLLVAPRTSDQLADALPGADPLVIEERLLDFAHMGLTEMVAQGPGQPVFHRVTDYAKGVEPILDALGRWGARRMGYPSATDVSSNALLASALRSAYREGVVIGPLTFAVRSGPTAAWASVTSTDIEVGEGTPAHADLTVTAGMELRAILGGRLTAEAALDAGLVDLDGPPELFRQFCWIFHVPLDEDVQCPMGSEAVACASS